MYTLLKKLKLKSQNMNNKQYYCRDIFQSNIIFYLYLFIHSEKYKK